MLSVHTTWRGYMLEIVQHLEQSAARFNPPILIASGLVCVAAGLFIWLGGLGFRKLLVPTVGAIAGVACATLMFAQNITLTLIFAAIAAVIARIFEKAFIIILTVVLAVAFCFAILAGACTEYDRDSFTAQPEYEKQMLTGTFSASRTVEAIAAYVDDLVIEIEHIASQMPLYYWAIITALAVIVIIAGLYFWRLTSALCYATWGTLLVFAGMIFLLLYKGAAPVSHITGRILLYAAVFIAMAAFGTIGQLILCRPIKQKQVRKKQTKKNAEQSDEGLVDWRTK